jgi:hypothetical protein
MENMSVYWQDFYLSWLAQSKVMEENQLNSSNHEAHLHKTSVRSSQKTHCISVNKHQVLNTPYSENHTKYTYRVCDRNTDPINLILAIHKHTAVLLKVKPPLVCVCKNDICAASYKYK